MRQYLNDLKSFFFSLKLEGDLDKQSREFLARIREDGGREWAQNSLKYFIRDKKQKVEDGVHSS